MGNQNKIRINMNDQRGFGLIELMFVVGLTTLVLSGIFQAINTTFKMQMASRTNENLQILNQDLANYLEDNTRCKATMAATKLKTFDRDELLGHNAGSQQIIPNTTTINGVALTDYAFDNVGIKDLRIQLKYHQGDNIFTGHMKIYSTDRFNGKDVRQKPGALDIAMQIDPSTGVIVGCSTRGVESLKTALGLTEGKKEVTGTGGLTGTGTCPPDTVVTGFSASSVICTALAGKGILKEDKTTLVAGK